MLDYRALWKELPCGSPGSRRVRSLASCKEGEAGVRMLAQALMEAEVTELVSAERHERNDERTGYRNGSRPRVWDTRVGTIELAVPRV